MRDDYASCIGEGGHSPSPQLKPFMLEHTGTAATLQVLLCVHMCVCDLRSIEVDY